jgi:hypothetical protein
MSDEDKKENLLGKFATAQDYEDLRQRVMKLEREVEFAILLNDMRAHGWLVAVHNDYSVRGVNYTFWLFTKDQMCVKGESRFDVEALKQARTKAIALASLAEAW